MNIIHSSAEPGQISGVESQHSQVSLFSGSEAGSSLDLFSQPPNQADNIIASGSAANYMSASCIKSSHGDYPLQPCMVRPDPFNSSTGMQNLLQAGNKKYYMKYLSLQPPTKESTAGNASILSDNGPSVSSKMDFEAWKDKQQTQLERYVDS